MARPIKPLRNRKGALLPLVGHVGLEAAVDQGACVLQQGDDGGAAGLEDVQVRHIHVLRLAHLEGRGTWG